MDQKTTGERELKTLPGLGPEISRDHRAFLASPLRRWETEEARLVWFLEQVETQEARDDVAHWYGELWGRPRRPGQMELALAALARIACSIAKVAIEGWEPPDEELALYREVCLAHVDRVQTMRVSQLTDRG